MGVLWASCLSILHYGSWHTFQLTASSIMPSTVSRSCRRAAVDSIDVGRRDDGLVDGSVRAIIRGGQHDQSVPPGTSPAAAIGLEHATSVTIDSIAHLLISELGHFSLKFGRVGLFQRLLRHRAEPTH